MTGLIKRLILLALLVGLLVGASGESQAEQTWKGLLVAGADDSDLVLECDEEGNCEEIEPSNDDPEGIPESTH